MTDLELQHLLKTLVDLPRETEWVEWKANNATPDEIGEYLSALSNSAALHRREAGYLVWGVSNAGKIIGTTFKPRRMIIGAEELENWLSTQLTPRINFSIHEFMSDGHPIVIFQVQPAFSTPVRWKSTEFIRVGSYKKSLKDHTEKERELWDIFRRASFENAIALGGASSDRVLTLLDYPAFFDQTKMRLPDNRAGILDRLQQERFIIHKSDDRFDILNLGAILYAKKLSDFDRLGRKALRVIVYNGANRVETLRELSDTGRGYAAVFEQVIDAINSQLPQNEQLGRAIRREVRMYPDKAIRELLANALIHQDFSMGGTGPMVEIFADRMEITNPGRPLVDPLRFIDTPPRSRNEALASFMRRIGTCEERGSGIDKVIFEIEFYQLPAPDFTVTSEHTKATMFAHKTLTRMDRDDRIRACYQHCCLQYVSNQRMSNETLRKRFGISDENYSAASRIIRDTVDANLVKPDNPANRSNRHARYAPFWA